MDVLKPLCITESENAIKKQVTKLTKIVFKWLSRFISSFCNNINMLKTYNKCPQQDQNIKYNKSMYWSRVQRKGNWWPFFLSLGAMQLLNLLILELYFVREDFNLGISVPQRRKKSSKCRDCSSSESTIVMCCLLKYSRVVKDYEGPHFVWADQIQMLPKSWPYWPWLN